MCCKKILRPVTLHEEAQAKPSGKTMCVSFRVLCALSKRVKSESDVVKKGGESCM